MINKLIIIFLMCIGLSCSKNPLGESELSSCAHSTGKDVGLPKDCLTSLSDTENLILWLDLEDPGFAIQEDELVSDVFDKSGQSNSLEFVSGDQGVYKKAEINDRGALLFSQASALYSVPSFSGSTANSNFSIFIALATDSSVQSGTFKINLNPDLEISLDSSGDLVLNVASVEFRFAATIAPNSLNKIALLYDAVGLGVSLYVNGDLIEQKPFGTISYAAWSDFTLESQDNLVLSEILTYTSLKTEQERREINTYFNQKWGF